MKQQVIFLCSLLVIVANCQQVAVRTPEYHPPLPIQSCDASGCVTENTAVVMDAGARRILSVADNDVYCLGTDGWDYTLCPDGTACAQNCGIDGISQDEYNNRYGVSTEGSTLRLDYYTESEYGVVIGSRVYIIGEDNNYRLFYLKNRELSVTADLSTLSCGLNGALYFSEMDGDGGVARFPDNQAGAAYGTGYCDGQCPHYLRFSNGQINTEGETEFGICCSEMDILEANRWASTYTTHGCLTDGYYVCYGADCGDGDDGNYHNGLCDKSVCEFSPARQNNRYFLGYNTSFELQTTQPFTAVTQFITDDGTDTGNLVEIRRRWFQNGVEIPNPVANWGYSQDYDSITDGYCNEYKSFFGEYYEQRGLDSMGAAFERGMVLALSLWEDASGYMQWLDSLSPPDGDPATPGVYRGPCPVDAGHPEDNHANNPGAFVTFSDIKIGTIGSTFLKSSLTQ